MYFRIPTEHGMRKEWMDILSKYRVTDGNSVCQKHFDSNDFIAGKKRLTLRKGAVPLIFETNEIVAESCNADCLIESDTTEAVNVAAVCAQCETLTKQLSLVNNRCAELSDELLKLKNQMGSSDLVRFALNNNYTNEMVIIQVIS